jgi:hypothetical protein
VVYRSMIVHHPRSRGGSRFRLRCPNRGKGDLGRSGAGISRSLDARCAANERQSTDQIDRRQISHVLVISCNRVNLPKYPEHRSGIKEIDRQGPTQRSSLDGRGDMIPFSDCQCRSELRTVALISPSGSQ